MGIECPKCKAENTSDSEFCKKCAAPLPSSKEIPVTKTLEKSIQELLGGETFAFMTVCGMTHVLRIFCDE